MRLLTTAFCIGCLSAPAAFAASAPWLEIKSAHFTIVTNAGEKAGRKAAWQFEQVRDALKATWPWAVIDAGRPMTVFAVKDEATLKTLGPQYWEGKGYRPTSFSVATSDRNYVALRTNLPEPDEVGENPYQTAYWHYVSLVLRRSLPVAAPYWYTRGIASVISNTIVREKEIHVGRAMRDHLKRMRETAPIPLAEFLAADRRSRYAVRGDAAYHFDSQAWAFVHYLLFSNQGENSGRLNLFNQLLLQGVAADAAQKQAFGDDLSPYFQGMREYLNKPGYSYARLPVALDLKMEEFSSRPLTESESSVLRAHFLVAMSRPVEARLLAAEASKLDPKSPGPFEIEALLLDREGKKAEALLTLEKAVSLGSTSGETYYRLAQLTRAQTPLERAANEKVATLLVRAIELDPQLAGAYSFLAGVKTDLGDPAAAVPLALKASQMEPESPYHRLALARALWNSNRHDEAIGAAQSALQVADSDEARARAQDFLDFAAKARPSVPDPSPQIPADTAADPALPAMSEALAPRGPEDAAAAMRGCFNERKDEDCARAVPTLRADCEAGDGWACRSLGSFYDGGFGVGMDKVRAGEIYDFGCRKAGDKSSCARHAVLQAQGLVPAPSETTGRSTLERLCGEGVDDACVGLALLLASPSGGAQLPKARLLLQASCDKGNVEACHILETLPAR